MSEQPTPSEPREPSIPQNASGVTVQPGGDATVGGDVVGRDKIQTTTTVTNVGMPPEAVRRLVLSVGILVFVTALCFFSGGIVVGFATLQAFARPGQAFQWTYAENDLSSYMRFILGPQIGFDARARILSSEEVAFQGTWTGMLGLPVTVVTRMETNSPQLYHTVSAAVQILPLPNSNLGWVALPASTVQPLVDAINQNIGQGYVAKVIDFPSFEAIASGGLAPPLGAPLRIVGVSD
jgi:hypothetical protein